MLTEDRASLVYVHSNLRPLENIQAVNYIETTVEWDGNNGLLLILTLNNTDLSVTCQC